MIQLMAQHGVGGVNVESKALAALSRSQAYTWCQFLKMQASACFQGNWQVREAK
jgi:hypothetical protein